MPEGPAPPDVPATAPREPAVVVPEGQLLAPADPTTQRASVVTDARLEAPVGAPPRQGRLALVLGALSALGPLSIDAYLPSLPSIAREFSTRDGAVELSLSAYFVGLAGAQLGWGVLADRVGRRAPLLAGLGLYTLASLVCMAAPDLPTLVVARCLQGVGGAATAAIVRAIVRDHWSGREAAQAMSLITLVMGAAPILAPVLGGQVLALSSWRAIFALLSCAGLAAVALVAWQIPGGRPRKSSGSLRDAVRLALADPALRVFAVASAASQAGMFAYIAGAPSAYQQRLGLTPSQFAVCFGLNASGLIACSQLNRALLKRWGPGEIASWGSRGMALCAVALALCVSTAGPSLYTVLPLVFGFVTLIGIVTANTIALALEAHGARAGLVSALLGTVQFACSALASAVVGLLADGTMRPMTWVMSGFSAVAAAAISLGVSLAKAPDAAPTAG